ncbi:hypothetical protein A1O3_10388 [Capronia epimyces CBS 606.96]|uniref:Uncharacterized protein n=1 Tax=Capronia epimyces CBS 606.96 TaxID=1182542 RepID=W9XIP5_9EURO|nr:uncharacterized protein A1O3_10388 [Capronia epimyces CBS 606.96]EXJ77230.1 hypothetical protein A1O3_10388 [Capronia epimyces CBS 606.96]
MESLTDRKRHQQCGPLHEIIQDRREKTTGMKPAWYYLAQSKMPELRKEAVRLLQDQYRLEALSGDQTTTTHKWAQVEHQLREKMPTEFHTLDRLQQHVEIWTVCNKEKIAQLFQGAITEAERLNVLLGPTIDIAGPAEALRQG